MRARSLLRITKVVHTVAWAGFVACIGSIFVFTRWGEIPRAAIAIGIVFFEVLALVIPGLKHPHFPRSCSRPVQPLAGTR